MDSYEEFLELTKKLYLLEQTSHLLSWDEEVLLTPGGRNNRAEQSGLIATVSHQTLTSKRYGELIEELSQNKELSSDQKIIVERMQYQYERTKNVPEKLAQELAITSSQAFHKWREAREKKDFSIFAPTLKKLVDLLKQKAQTINSQQDHYTTLLQDYDPYFSVEEITQHFSTIKKHLVPLVEQISSCKQPDTSFLTQEVPEKTQEAFCKDVAEQLGFDFTNGRLDISTHPFTASPADVRITTRYSDGWAIAITALIHETGHALYEQGLPQEHTPLGEPVSIAVHESQSHIWEDYVSKSKEFCELITPKLQQQYPVMKDKDATTLYKAINKVEPSHIRVTADELTYPLHIILRFEIEQELIAGTITVEDLPTIWAQKSQELLGITPDDDAQGILQDVHWSAGMIGYFPTYLLGSIMASQFMSAATKQDPNIPQDLKEGNYCSLLSWLRENIHSQGHRYDTKTLLKKTTGEELNPQHYLEHLEKKYRELYNI